jgi:hypothetical protein
MLEIVQNVTSICSLLKFNKVASRRLKNKTGINIAIREEGHQKLRENND